MGQGIDYLVGQGLVEFDLLFHQIIVIMMSVLLTSLFSWLVVRFSNLVTYSMTRDLRIRLFDSIHHYLFVIIDAHSEIAR